MSDVKTCTVPAVWKLRLKFYKPFILVAYNFATCPPLAVRKFITLTVLDE